MKEKEFKKLLKTTSPIDIIRMYCMNKIYLYSKQLDKVIKLKNEKAEYKNIK